MRFDWSLEEIASIYESPLLQLLYRAQHCHREHQTEDEMQLCRLVNVKPGGCAENCTYCAQSVHNPTGFQAKPLITVAEVIALAQEAKRHGASRVCLGAAWREVRDGPPFSRILEMVRAVKSMGLEVCCTLGMLSADQAKQLKEAGLYAYNHNLDTSREHYSKIVTTRTYDERLQTLQHVRQAGITVCCGGILGLGEQIEDRLKLLQTLSSLRPHPESVPINLLVPISGTPLESQQPVSVWELARLIATTRLLMPETMIRLTAGRKQLTVSEQTLCYLAGANSIFIEDSLLTTSNVKVEQDQSMLKILGLKPRKPDLPMPLACKGETASNFMQQALEERKHRGALRTLVASNDLVDLTSNDYLGLARSMELAERIQREYEALISEGGIRPIVGATGSRLLTGNSAYYEALESQIATFHRAEAGLLFNTGYLANTGLLSAVASEGDIVICDSQVHASVWDGVRLSRAKMKVFGHQDVDQLRWQLARSRKEGGKLFVCVESLYSLSGDLAPLECVADLCEEFGARLIVDEAHATGVRGPEGRGEVVARGLTERVFARVHTFGKALGIQGGIVLGSTLLRQFLINFSRPLIYTTALTLHAQVSMRCAYEFLERADPLRLRLNQLIAYFQLLVKRSELPVQTTSTPIQSILIRGNEGVCRAASVCSRAGLSLRPILYPTVREGMEQLRLCLHAFNSETELDRLIEVLGGELRVALAQ